MKSSTIQKATLVLGVLSLAVLVLERLALTDIVHGEPDVTLEWSVVNAAFLPILAFHALAIGAAVQSLRRR